jgi:hypothetical protein
MGFDRTKGHGEKFCEVVVLDEMKGQSSIGD